MLAQTYYIVKAEGRLDGRGRFGFAAEASEC